MSFADIVQSTPGASSGVSAPVNSSGILGMASIVDSGPHIATPQPQPTIDPTPSQNIFQKSLSAIGNGLHTFWNQLLTPPQISPTDFLPKTQTSDPNALQAPLIPGAADVISKQNANDLNSNGEPMGSNSTIYLPGNSGSFNLPPGLPTDVLKGAVEAPQKLVNTFQEWSGNSPTKYNAFVGSYNQDGKQAYDQAIADGMSPTLATVFGIAKGLGNAANDALLFSGPLEKGLSKTSDVLEPLFKDTLVENKLPQTIHFSGSDVQQAMAGGDLAPKDTADLIKVIGGDPEKIKNAFKNGISIDIPAQKIVTLQDKPYWAKIKNFFGVDASVPIISTTNAGEASQGVRGILTPGNPVHDTIASEIAKASETMPADQVSRHLQIGLGAPGATADELAARPFLDKMNSSIDNNPTPTNNQKLTPNTSNEVGLNPVNGEQGSEKIGVNSNDGIEKTQVSGNKTSGLAQSINQKAIEAKLTEGFGHLAEYNSSTIKEQATLSEGVISKGVDNILSTLNGSTDLPAGLKGGPFIVSVETYLKANPNPTIAEALANSHLTSSVSEGASQLGLMQNREQDSATKALQDIRKAKIAAAGGEKAIAKARTAVKKVINSVLSPKEEKSIEDFLNSIEAC